MIAELRTERAAQHANEEAQRANEEARRTDFPAQSQPEHQILITLTPVVVVVAVVVGMYYSCYEIRSS
jgi:hypothetical protein